MNDILYGNIIYQQKGEVEIYEGFIKSTNKKVCIKTLYAYTLEKANKLLAESFNMIRFKDSNVGIVKFYFNEITSDSEGRYVVKVVMEYFNKGDLSKYINDRKGYFWPEPELINYLKQLVLTFAYLQEKHMAHRDIKPENIFVSDDYNNLIVGDFGSSAENLAISSTSIVGTPLYLSPEIRNIYYSSLFGKGVREIGYNPYKSDVYSLGLTILHMATLVEPVDLISMGNLEQNTIDKVNSLSQYPTLKEYLFKMLNYNSSSRPDFIELKEILGLNTQIKEICSHCQSSSTVFSHRLDEYKICETCTSNLDYFLWNSNPM